jgi:hypothetical protein
MYPNFDFWFENLATLLIPMSNFIMLATGGTLLIFFKLAA